MYSNNYPVYNNCMDYNELLEKWKPLIYKLAGKYAKKASATYIEYDDLVSVGMMAIIEARETLDTSKASMMTRAYSIVSHRMQNEISENRDIKRGHVNFTMRLNKAYRELGEDATDEEIIKWCKKNYKDKSSRITKNNIEDIKIMANVKHRTIDGLLNLSVESTIEEDVDYSLKLQKIHECLNKLKPIEQSVILGRMDGRTLEDLSKEHNCTREWIRIVEKQSIKKLSKMVSPIPKVKPIQRPAPIKREEPKPKPKPKKGVKVEKTTKVVITPPSVIDKTLICVKGYQYKILEDIGRGFEVLDESINMRTVIKYSEVKCII